MDIFSAPVIDAGIFLGLFFFFIIGMMQGAIRRILGIISILFAFLIAANLRDPRRKPPEGQLDPVLAGVQPASWPS